jgi:diguanylate cyclase (GGDEF)-like protein
VVLADDVDPTKALRLGERLIEDVSAPYDLGDGISARIGISIGIALSPDHGEDFTSLLTAADRALYQAKLQGKGRCRIAQDMQVKA